MTGIALVKTISASISGMFRKVKVQRYGKNDVLEVNEATPWGVDSNPVAGANAYYSNTTINGQGVVLGYSNKGQKSQPGETRLFSTNTSGVFKYNVWLRENDILIGASSTPGDYSNFAARYNQLETAFNELKGKHNDLVTAFNAHVHPTAATGSPSPPTIIPGSIPAVPSSADITGAKAETIKVL